MARAHRHLPRISAALVATCLAGCADDPAYLASGLAIEVGADGETTLGSATLTLPIRLETADEAADRAALAAELGVVVPYVARGDLDVEIEWLVRNLEERPTEVRVSVNGASELISYRPETLVIDEEDEEPPPPLMGDVPYVLEAGADRQGVFREDQIAEAALDLELMSRGALSAFTAILGVDEARTSFVDAAGVEVPERAWAGMVRFDLAVTADGHVVFEYAVRVRDHRDPDVLHPRLLDAPAGELVAFAPVEYVLPIVEGP